MRAPQILGLSSHLQELLGERYVGTQYLPTVACGKQLSDSSGEISVDLEKQCFPDESFDVVITQDVFEHIYNASAAFKEIARTLRAGGMHIFTVPTPAKLNPTYEAATMAAGYVQLNAPPEVHGNPVAGSGGALLTRQWGYDIVDFILAETGMRTFTFYVESDTLGISHAEYREVFVSVKSVGPDGLEPTFVMGSCPRRTYQCQTAFDPSSVV